MFSYSVKYVCGQNQVVASQGCSSVRQGIYSTEINIHNFGKTPAQIVKRILQVVSNDSPVGREPGVAPARQFDAITLPPDSATIDDCFHFADKLQFNPSRMNIGFMEIVSNVELNVVAVYTASDLKAASIAMDVETVSARQV